MVGNTPGGANDAVNIGICVKKPILSAIGEHADGVKRKELKQARQIDGMLGTLLFDGLV